MRLMAWNIQFFTLKRILNNEGNSLEERIKNLSISTYNYNHICGTIIAGDPDVFIVIEPRSNDGTLGSIATGGGPDGLYYIYEGLNIGTGATNWSLVPPLKTVNKDIHGTTYTEAVGIFYRNDRLEFLGPWGWPAAVQNTPSNGPSVPPGNNVQTGPYPGRWNGTMPARTDGITYAAQFQFFADNEEVWFPLQGSRRPILTKFRERQGQNPRTFKIFACHTTPKADPKTAVARVANLAEAVPGNGEVVVLAGDFNVDYLSTKTTDTTFFSYMTGIEEYRQCFGLTNNNTKTTTMTKPVNDATPVDYLKNAGYDNVFVKYGAQAAGAPANAIIIDRCAGVNNTVYDSDMEESIDEIMNMMFDENEADPRIPTFRNETNYGHIGNYPGTSDHLAIVVDL
jgi:hypothetical protein